MFGGMVLTKACDWYEAHPPHHWSKETAAGYTFTAYACNGQGQRAKRRAEEFLKETANIEAQAAKVMESLSTNGMPDG